VLTGGVRLILRADEGLESADLTVYGGQILFDYVCELGDLDGLVVEERFAFGYCRSGISPWFRKEGLRERAAVILPRSRHTLRQSLQLVHRVCDAAADLGCAACELPTRVGGLAVGGRE
jgi:hypothetical protein